MIPIDTTKKETTKQLVPAGNHVARIYSILHLGTTEEDTKWGLKDMNKVRITWELPHETRVFKEGEEEKPLVISQEYNLTFGEMSNMYKLLTQLLGKDAIAEGEIFDVESLIDMPCMVNITHKTKGDKTYANILSVAPLPKGMPAPEQFNPSLILNYTDKWDEVAFEALPDFIKDKMRKSREYHALHDAETDDTPF
jgi:hypothetical protein